MASTKDSRKNLIFSAFLFSLIMLFSLFIAPFAINRTIVVCESADLESGTLKIHYVDVGQGDAIFIELPDGNKMLIDAGPQGAKTKLVNYITALGISKINYLVLTHSDSDHVGGMVEILNSFEVENIYRPFVLASKEGTNDELAYYSDSVIYAVDTAVYSNFIKAAYTETFEGNLSNIYINYDGIVILSEDEHSYVLEFHTPPVASTESTESKGLRAVGYPTKKYESSNSAYIKNAVSPIISLSYGDKKYLFTGDANELSEPDFIENLPTSGPGAERADACRNVDVLKVAHHGSKTSTSQEFLNIVNPKYAVICVGEGNTYGLPKEETLTRLNNLWDDDLLRLLRTDKNGDIIATSTGSTINFEFTLDGERTTMDSATGIKSVAVKSNEPEKQTIPKWVIYVIVAVAIIIVIIGLYIKFYQMKKAKKRRRRR